MKSKKDGRQALMEMMVKVNPTMKINLNENIQEANAGINPKYTHFAVLKSNNKIVNGWDYNGHEQSELNQFKRDYFFNDIADMGINPKLVAIYTKRTLENRGINPLDTNNWFKFEADGWRDRKELNEIGSLQEKSNWFESELGDLKNNQTFTREELKRILDVLYKNVDVTGQYRIMYLLQLFGMDEDFR
jgi:hypothetical protein